MDRSRIGRIERILARDETDADALMQLGSLYVRTRAADIGSPGVSSSV